MEFPTDLARLIEDAITRAMHPQPTISAAELVARYLDDLAGRVRPMHLLNRRVELALAVSECKSFSVSDLLAWRRRLVERGASNRRANVYIHAVRAAPTAP